jgi:hypothetical protein
MKQVYAAPARDRGCAWEDGRFWIVWEAFDLVGVK